MSTEPVRKAAEMFLASLTAPQLKITSFPAADDEWRRWMNQSFYVRQGVSFLDMIEPQREAAFALLRAGLSAKGLKLTRDIMRLNHTLAELNDNNFAEYGEWLYHITVMGTPSATEPWGWQFDGHHAIINYFVLGDQVVMTPFFTGSEPATAAAGKYAGTTILRDEQQRALAFVNGLADAQRAKAILSFSKTGNNILTEAWKDNVVLDYAGLRATELTDAQRRQLIDLVGLVRRQHGRGTRAGADGRGASAPRSDLVRVDRQDRPRRGVLLPHPQPGHPDRVRSQRAGEPAAPGRGPDVAERRAHPHHRAHAERQRLRQGSTAAALLAAPALESSTHVTATPQT